MLESNNRRLQIEITGHVQGVGFRPYCHALAQDFQIVGWVLNHGSGVRLEIQGEKTEEFLQALQSRLPPLAHIDTLAKKIIPVENDEHEFIIRDSLYSTVSTNIPPDSSVCNACLEELFNPGSRYYRYPFINCTHCGPRFTVVKHLPYDRCNTALAEFDLCPDCKSEYQDVSNRRFHAQATACPVCGPQLSMSVKEIIQHLKQGKILGVKGLGGFHLVCDATNHSAVIQLRKRKNREAKPFAIMAANIKSLEQFVELTEAEKAQLYSPQRPIVLANKKTSTKLSPSLAPGLNSLGVVLPYTPLQYLLFNVAAGEADGIAWLNEFIDLALVMTSANPGGEPLVIDNQMAQQQLADIADVIVEHNRDIVTRCDDTVMRVTHNTAVFIRRARSYTPQAIKLPKEIPPILAVGGYLKNTMCLSRENNAYLSQHIGDLDNRRTCDFFEETLQHLLDTLQVKPQIIAHDQHPDFFSSRFAQKSGLATVTVQHHHAHLAAVAAEHGVTSPAIGLALDGFGLGENNQSWGGELMLLNKAHYQRLGHLALLKQPGADKASLEPWRMAAAVFHRLNRHAEIETHFPQPGAALLKQMLEKNLNCPSTSSAGRLFDAAAGLLGIQPITNYEGQAAMMLESLVSKPQVLKGGWQIVNNQLDFLPLLEQLITCEPVDGANLFHGTLIAGLSQWLEQNADQCGTDIVLLAGGCFLNKILCEGLIHQLIRKNLSVKMAQQAPVNDGGLSLGQLWIAGLTAE